MDELNDLRDVVDQGGAPAPADLADRLWPDVIETYRQVAGSGSTVDERIPLLPVADESQASTRPAPIWIAVAAAVITAIVVSVAVLGGGTTIDTEPDPAAREGEDGPVEQPNAPAADLDALCADLRDAIGRADPPTAAAAVAALLEASESGELRLDDTSLAALRRADGAFIQADLERAAGRPTAAETTEEFGLRVLDDGGTIPGCPG